LKHDIKAEAIHGNKSQNARQNALNNFKEKSTRVLVATDIAARGIDVDELAYVINFEIPEIPETYVHRIGRTGRAGAKGTAYSFCDTEERGSLKDIQKLIAKVIPVIEDHPFPLSQKPGNEAPKAHNVANTNRNNRPSRPASNPSSQPKTPTGNADRGKKPWFAKRGR
jgi:ATP-dependent RNA helicase RhlE